MFPSFGSLLFILYPQSLPRLPHPLLTISLLPLGSALMSALSAFILHHLNAVSIAWQVSEREGEEGGRGQGKGKGRRVEEEGGGKQKGGGEGGGRKREGGRKGNGGRKGEEEEGGGERERAHSYVDQASKSSTT